MNAIIVQNKEQPISPLQRQGWFFIALFLLALCFSSYHHASHDAQSSHMHCKVCWQASTDFDQPNHSELKVADNSFIEPALKLFLPEYSLTICHFDTCRGPPSIS